MESMQFYGNRGLLPPLVKHPSFLTTSLPYTKLNFTKTHINYTKFSSVRKALIRPVIRAESGNYDGRKIVKGVSVAMACVLGIIGSFKMNQKAIAGPREYSSKAPHRDIGSYALNGKSALESLFEVNVRLASSESIKLPSSLPHEPSTEEVKNIYKMKAVRLMKDGKTGEAVSFLQKEYNRLSKYARASAYEIEMALVEILICQGKYQEALKCNCLREDDPTRIHSDGRFPLYKAIIHTMLDDVEHATKWWEEYTKAVQGGLPDPRGIKF